MTVLLLLQMAYQVMGEAAHEWLGMGMTALVIVHQLGSPNRKGSTAILVDHFIKGATEAGHACEVLDVCHMNIHPCTGCVRCGYEGPCVQKDDVETIRAKLLKCDMVMFATSLYYYTTTYRAAPARPWPTPSGKPLAHVRNTGPRRASPESSASIPWIAPVC